MTPGHACVPKTCVSASSKPLWLKMAAACRSFLLGQKIDQPCLLKSEMLYFLLSLFDRKGDYRVNLVVTFYCTGDRGHAWLTRNGKPFPASAGVDAGETLTLVGENHKYRYLVKESNLQKWLDTDLPRCNAM